MAETKEIKKYLQQTHDKIFESNRKWAEEQRAKNPEFFEKLDAGQSPDYLWIGESSSLPPPSHVSSHPLIPLSMTNWPSIDQLSRSALPPATKSM
jgi:hypothetical protein